MTDFTRLDAREAPTTAFALSFAPDPWLTPQRQAVITAAFAEWGQWLSEPLPAITSAEYAVYDGSGRLLDTAPQIPPDTYRVWVGTGRPTSSPDALAEAGPVGWSAWGVAPQRSPGGFVTIDATKVTDATLPAVALHEAGHTFGLGHQPLATPAQDRGVMYPYLDPAHTHLTGVDARDWLWANPAHSLPPGTRVTGVGTTPGGWFVYDPTPDTPSSPPPPPAV